MSQYLTDTEKGELLLAQYEIEKHPCKMRYTDVDGYNKNDKMVTVRVEDSNDHEWINTDKYSSKTQKILNTFPRAEKVICKYCPANFWKVVRGSMSNV